MVQFLVVLKSQIMLYYVLNLSHTDFHWKIKPENLLQGQKLNPNIMDAPSTLLLITVKFLY